MIKKLIIVIIKPIIDTSISEFDTPITNINAITIIATYVKRYKTPVHAN